MLVDSVALEVWVVELDESEGELVRRIWNGVDQQAIAIEARKTLDRNGMRCGLAPVESRMWVRKMVRGAVDIQSQSGQTQDVDAAPTKSLLAWTVEDTRGQRRTGSCDNATCCLAITTYPGGGGSAILDVKPKIRYGAPKNRYTVDNNQFTLQPILDELDFAELAFQCRIKLGQTLVIGSTETATGLGRHYFYDEAKRRNRLLLVRLVYSQLDDLFAPGKTKTPITTAD